ncbi:MAG: copper resistance protein B [Gammaproteobacteria bacterium]|nr:copper resistance protein B [Gammaproteobacteria bacterium]
MMMEIKTMKIVLLKSLATALLALTLSPALAQEPAKPEVDHSQMDHSKMGHPMPAATPDQGQDMSGMDHGSMQGGAAPPDARDPHAYSGGHTLPPERPLRMADEHSFGSFLMDRLERVRTRDNSSTVYDLQARYGRTYDRIVLKAEGDVDGGEYEDTHTQLLWGHAISAYWDTQLGVRYDGGHEPSRTWLAFGVQGLAPYWFEMDITGYLGENGRTALSIEAEYELLLTQKLVLQPRVEASFFGKRDAARETGSGLSDLAVGLRLRYEIQREFAPYIGIERSGKFGATADFARAKGNQTYETRIIGGVRFWF